MGKIWGLFLIRLALIMSFRNIDGVVVFLNGCSSAGKSSIARELKLMHKDYEVVSIDDLSAKYLKDFFYKHDPVATEKFFSIVDQSVLLKFFGFLDDKKRNQHLESIISDPDDLAIAKETGAALKKIFKSNMLSAFLNLWSLTKEQIIIQTKELAEQGKTVIVDHIAMDRSHLKKFAESLDDIPVVFIGIKAPFNVIQERELARGDRDLGTARLVYQLAHAHNCYDMLIDSSKMSPKEAALKIQKRINTTVKSGVFKNNLKEKLNLFKTRIKYAWLSMRTYARMGRKIATYKLTA